MLSVCDRDHLAICYEGIVCPFCEKLAELTDKIDEQKFEINDLQSQRDHLQERLDLSLS